MKFLNREDAARQLLSRLPPDLSRQDGIVLALPRGAVPMGKYIADHLHWPLDVVIVKKIGHPLNPEFAVGSVSATSYVVDKHQDLPADYVSAEVARLQREIQKKAEVYRSGRPPQDFRQKTVLLVDDGMATGSTMLGGIDLIRVQGAKQIVVAVPVASADAYRRVSRKADQVYCLAVPEPFWAVSQFYEEFEQVSDEEVIALLR